MAQEKKWSGEEGGVVGSGRAGQPGRKRRGGEDVSRTDRGHVAWRGVAWRGHGARIINLD